MADKLWDDFQTEPTDGQNLSATTNWTTHTRADIGVMRGDKHEHYGTTSSAGDSDNLMVVDMSTTGYARAIFQSGTLGSADQWVTLSAFLDTDELSGNEYGVLLRCADSSPETPLGYSVTVVRNKNATAGSQHDRMEITLLDGTTSDTVLDSTDMGGGSGQRFRSEDGLIVITASIIGTVITGYYNGFEALSYDTSGDTTVIASGGYVGFQADRAESATDSQPFVANWGAWVDCIA